jgi:hypothetical protein
MSRVDEQQPMDEKAIAMSSGDNAQQDGLKEVGSIEPQIDPAKEKILLAKLDLFFTPIIMLVYLSCFLDRSNIVCDRRRG